MTKNVSLDEAAATIPDGSRIVIPPGFVGPPTKLLDAIGRRSWKLGIEVMLSVPEIPESVVRNRGIRLATWHILGKTRSLVSSKRVELLPWRYSDLARFLARRWDRPKVLVTQVGPSVGEGKHVPGVAGSVVLDLANNCDLALAEVNCAQPRLRTFDGAEIEFDAVSEVEAETPVVQARRLTPVEQRIGQHVASLIPNGATLQLGIGGALDAVAEALTGHRGLGIHSGMVSDAVQLLTERGAVTNEHKGWMHGVTVTGLVIGTDGLVRWVDGNPDVVLAPISVTHNPRTLVDLRAFVAVNSAVEVDLHGQVGAESIGGEPFAGMGGQPDFAFAAASSSSPGSCSIVALPSTTSDGSRSRIVPRLDRPGLVTTPRYCVDFVVTEWGVAALRGLSTTEREKALLNIAHPAHRAALELDLRTNRQPTATR